jgi:PAS domain S-box-containing protein
MKKSENKSYKKGLRERAEEFISKNPSAIKKMPPCDVTKLIEDLQIHQVELEMQNEELRQAQLELEAARDRYSNLYDFAPVGYFTIGEKGMILESNLTGATMLGVERGLLIGNPFTNFINRDDQDIFYHYRKKLIETKATQADELRLVKKDGSGFYAQLECIAAEDPSGNCSQLRMAVMDITARKQAQDNLTASLKEKELLLQEIHHRVKNNMQVISSLLKLQAATIEEESLRAPFRESEHRVRAMSLVHEKLYQSKDFTHVPFRDYLTSLIRYLYQSSAPQAGRIELVTEIEELPLTITHAIPCGLIVNELVSNAFTHAFPGERKGTITISLRSPEPQAYELTVSDNGIGLPEAIDPHTTTSLGLHLITILVEDQLKGEITVERTGGTRVRIRFRTQQ